MAYQLLTSASDLVSDYCTRYSVADPQLKAVRKKAARLQRNKDPQKKEELRLARAGPRRSTD